MAWVKTDQFHTGILAKNDGDTSWEQGEKVFYIENSTGYPSFVGHSNDYIKGNVDITDNLWHHVAVVWDYDGSGINGVGRMYVDGVDVTGYDGYRANLDDRSGSTFKIGFPNYGEAQQLFVGQLDELVAYQRALTAAEIETIYLLELRWYRDQAIQEIVIDNDNPTLDMVSTYQYRADGYIQLVATAQDATSAVSLVQFGLKGPADSDFVWDTAAACVDSSVTYCPAFTSSGEGTYEIQFRVVDAVGNETTSSVYSFYVDDTAPTVSSGSGGVAPLSLNSSLSFSIVETSDFDWTITLSGEVNDPDVGSVAGSGVTVNDITVTLVDERGHVLGSPNQTVDTLVSGTWTATYDVTGVAAPLGSYTVLVTAADALGNTATTTLGTIALDESNSDTQFADLIPAYAISDTQTVTGVVYDHPAWYGLSLDLHFEEAAGSQRFHDYGRYANHATCITCPTTTTDTPFGRALQFDGIDDTIVISGNATLDENLNGDLTIAFWVKADATQSMSASPTNTILTSAAANEGGYVIAYVNQTAGTLAGQLLIARTDGTNSITIQSNARPQ